VKTASPTSLVTRSDWSIARVSPDLKMMSRVQDGRLLNIRVISRYSMQCLIKVFEMCGPATRNKDDVFEMWGQSTGH